MDFFGIGQAIFVEGAFFIALYSACAVWGLRTYGRRLADGGTDAFWAALLPALGLTLTLLFAHKVATSVFYNENWMRLHKTFYLWSEGKLYLPPEQGPVLNTLYGPGTALAYSTAVLFREPHAVMYAAAASAMLFFFVPTALLFVTTEQARRNPLRTFAIACGFMMSVFFIPSLRNAAFRVHADAPMLGLSALSCVFLIRGRRGGLARWMWASAVCAAMAAWTKQVALPLGPALVAVVWIAEGSRAGVRHLVRAVVAFAAVSAVVLALFDREAMWFQMVTVPQRHPWELGKDFHPKVVFSFVREWVMAAGIAALWARGLPRSHWRKMLSTQTWAMLLFVGICMLPAAIMGRLKIGGSINTLSHCNYFFFAAAFAGFVGHAAPKQIGPRRFKAPETLVVFLLAAQIICLGYKLFVNAPLPDYANTAYRYLKTHPGKAYFPRLALIHFLVEGRHYNDTAAVRDRVWAGMPVSEKALREFEPSGPRLAAFYELSEVDLKWMSFVSLEGPLDDPELPHFRVYRINDKRPADDERVALDAV